MRFLDFCPWINLRTKDAVVELVLQGEGKSTDLMDVSFYRPVAFAACYAVDYFCFEPADRMLCLSAGFERAGQQTF